MDSLGMPLILLRRTQAQPCIHYQPDDDLICSHCGEGLDAHPDVYGRRERGEHLLQGAHMQPGMTPARTPSTQQQRTFGEALVLALDAQRVRRLAWPDDGSCIFFSIGSGEHARPGNGGILRYRDGAGTVHDMLVQDGDVTATDWIVVREN